MSEIKDFKITPTDENSENNGVWATYRGVGLLIARGGNPRFKALFRAKTKPYKHELERGTLDDDTMEKLYAETLARTILLDWKNHPSGAPYSHENATLLLLQDKDSAEFIDLFSKDLNNYLVQDTTDTVEK